MSYSLLSGIQWQRDRPNRLLIYLPHGVMKIEGIELATAAEAILSQLPTPASTEQLKHRASATAQLKPSICDYALNLLVKSRVLVTLERNEPLSDLEGYFYLVEGSLQSATRLKQKRVIVYCFAEDSLALERTFHASGIGEVILRPLETRMNLPGEELSNCDAVACIGPPFYHPFARALNRSALEHFTPVLFSEYGGGTARIGPTVIGRNLSCLDCVSTRHAANGGGAMLENVDQWRDAVDASPVRTLSHPILRELLVQHSVFEISRIVLSETPISFGGYLELNSVGETHRREVLKVPRCVSCASNAPERYPFDVTPLS